MDNSTRQGYLAAFGAVLIWSGFILVSRMGGISPLLSYDLILSLLWCISVPWRVY